MAKLGTNTSGILFSLRDNSSYRLYTLGPLCLWQCFVKSLDSRLDGGIGNQDGREGRKVKVNVENEIGVDAGVQKHIYNRVLEIFYISVLDKATQYLYQRYDFCVIHAGLEI